MGFGQNLGWENGLYTTSPPPLKDPLCNINTIVCQRHGCNFLAAILAILLINYSKNTQNLAQQNM